LVYSLKKASQRCKADLNIFYHVSKVLFRRLLMFDLFKRNPIKKMRKEYDALLEKAMHAQRNGDIRTYSMLTADAEALWKKIEKISD
tara:strand:- start:4396 stop:4656 length:261 start_codon:yes stop_codon:yes gene_type:complete